MTIQRKYRNKQPAFLSYTFEDFLTKTGSITFYPAKAASEYVLSSNQAVYSDIVLNTHSGIVNTTTDTIQVDLDYDILLNRPQNLQGSAYANVPLFMQGNTGGTGYKIYAVVKIRKWDGSTETEIASGTGDTYTSPGTAWPKKLVSLVKLNVPLTHFKKGEYLRITIQIHGWNTSGDGGSGKYGFGADPQGRSETIRDDATYKFASGDVTTLSIAVPFRLSL